MADYQWKKAIGRIFRSDSSSYSGHVSILGIPYTYKVVEGTPQKDKLLEVFDFQENELYVRVLNDEKGEFSYV